MPARLHAALMFCSCSARASIPMRARISCSRAVTIVSSGKGLVLDEPSSYHRSAVGALHCFRPVLSGDLPLSSLHRPSLLPRESLASTVYGNGKLTPLDGARASGGGPSRQNRSQHP